MRDEHNRRIFDWFFRFVKGIFIGSGFILPGVSGGALAAVFGLYERMISFMAHLNVEFRKNFSYFLPVGLGALLGIFVLSFPISYFLENAEAEVLWFFVGCILGVLPALFKQATSRGRQPRHLAIMLVTTVLAYFFLANMQSLIGGSLPLNFCTWLLAGAIIGLGVIVPGLSPSNFLVYLNMYKPMTDGIKNLDIAVIAALFIGAAITVIALSRFMNWLFARIYTGLYHFVIGVVLASTLMIVPWRFDYLSARGFVCLLACVAGGALGLWMSRLEERYKPN